MILIFQELAQARTSGFRDSWIKALAVRAPKHTLYPVVDAVAVAQYYAAGFSIFFVRRSGGGFTKSKKRDFRALDKFLK
jgi:hypothetical protein